MSKDCFFEQDVSRIVKSDTHKCLTLTLNNFPRNMNMTDSTKQYYSYAMTLNVRLYLTFYALER